jgi:hypothetical protein
VLGPDLVDALLQGDDIEPFERQLHEDTHLAFEGGQGPCEYLAPLPFLSGALERIGIAPVRRGWFARPVRKLLLGARIAEREDEIERR